jgi:lysozyme family protein
MASFATAHAVVAANEGGYANHPSDKGGETYAGIARVPWPSWSGWATIDAAKPLKANARVPAAQPHVDSFYRANYWDRQGLGNLRDQVVANVVMDTLVQHGRGGKLVQQAARALGAAVSVDGIVGAGTIAAINALDPRAYVARLLETRMDYYRSLSDWPVFGAGWTRRLQGMGLTAAKAAAGGVSMVLVAGIAFLVLKGRGKA